MKLSVLCIFLLATSCILIGSQKKSTVKHHKTEIRSGSSLSVKSLLVGTLLVVGTLSSLMGVAHAINPPQIERPTNSDGSPCIDVRYTKDRYCRSGECITYDNPYCADLTECDNCE